VLIACWHPHTTCTCTVMAPSAPLRLWPPLQSHIEARGWPPAAVSTYSLPDIYAFNNKRYERFWLGLLEGRDEAAVDAATLVVAWGAGADAALRFMERSPVHGAVLVGASDM
jgi:hypothetical protein